MDISSKIEVIGTLSIGDTYPKSLLKPYEARVKLNPMQERLKRLLNNKYLRVNGRSYDERKLKVEQTQLEYLVKVASIQLTPHRKIKAL